MTLFKNHHSTGTFFLFVRKVLRGLIFHMVDTLCKSMNMFSNGRLYCYNIIKKFGHHLLNIEVQIM